MEIKRGPASAVALAQAFTEVTFTTADLVAGVLSLAHAAGRMVDIHITKPAGGKYEMSGLDILHADDLNSLSIDFGGAIPAGTYTLHWR